MAACGKLDRSSLGTQVRTKGLTIRDRSKVIDDRRESTADGRGPDRSIHVALWLNFEGRQRLLIAVDGKQHAIRLVPQVGILDRDPLGVGGSPTRQRATEASVLLDS